MEFKQSPWSAEQRRQSMRARAKDAESAKDQPLQMYLVPPTGDVTLEEFDALAAERLQVLRTFERAGHVGKQKFSVEWEEFILSDLKRQKLNAYYQLLSRRGDSSAAAVLSAEALRRDHISHFILRLAYCRTEELRAWFIQHEVEMFRLRFQSQRTMDPDVGKFLADNGIHLNEVEAAERDRLREPLVNGTARVTADTLELTQWYTVPFVEALDLVRGRRVFLRAGMAYIPARDLGSIVAAKFRAHLQHALAMSRRLLPEVEEDSRLKSMLNDFDKRYTGRDYSAKGDDNTVTPEMIDDLSRQSFPPCMRELHERLRANHKLFHGGRQQYGLFLKAVGMSLDNAIIFWREEFTKVMDNDKFHKQYLYNIRHNYGQEGKRASYSAMPCSKILMSGSNDSGCPFKHYDRDHLGKMLSAHGIDKTGSSEIFELTERSQPQLACQKYWELVHRTPFEGAMQHPNQYYEESRKTFGGHRAKTDRGLDRSHVIRASLPAKPSPSGAAAANTSATQAVWDEDGDVEMSEDLLQSLEATG
ncbi:DNA primase large subunit-like [Amphibalanus amphitrite]|uniref:DNA primase large subunit-like n=1 Tax=Amphibalanus amphitrite TaxID=1232801 RepID=UPI001C909AA9|nr:DNA primase large subunit-like [Amphibalanus amphitrite]XP_043202734.1 DNA primase large subunit-like [Amphibalanus amphitrite]XP_043202743.1 DNA primase large subunit-like [Amphibalanus amphitrite]